MKAKDLRGWIALAIFVISCCFFGMNGYLLKQLNRTCIAMLFISIIIVALLKWPDKESENSKEEK